MVRLSKGAPITLPSASNTSFEFSRITVLLLLRMSEAWLYEEDFPAHSSKKTARASVGRRKGGDQQVFEAGATEVLARGSGLLGFRLPLWY